MTQKDNKGKEKYKKLGLIMAILNIVNIKNIYAIIRLDI